MDREAIGLEYLRRAREALGPELIELLLKAPGAVPETWRGWTAHRGFVYLRCRLRFTQQELAQKSQTAQSQVSRLEGGCDALLSTWRAVYAAMGFELLLLPVSALTLEQLEKRAEEGRPQGHWLRQRARPRRPLE